VAEHTTAPAPGSATAPSPQLKRFGRFELRALIHKSQRSMLWLVFDERLGQELLLCVPRQAPNSPAAMDYWLRTVNAVARLQHPNIAPVIEVGQVEHWPYAAYERSLGETLDERLSRQAAPLPIEAADWMAQYLSGLAFAHEAGHAHRDLQGASLLIDTNNKVRVLGLEIVQEVFPANVNPVNAVHRPARETAAEDVLCAGLMLHRILSGKHVLERNDVADILPQLQPVGHEIVRLGWETPHPIPDPLRAIANRSTDRQPRQRYQIARTFLRALEGWMAAASSDDGGPIALLIDKLQRMGHLPTTTSQFNHVANSTGFAAQHTAALSELVLKDMALSLELLRRVNNSLKQSGAPVDGTVLNMQRAIAMVGLEGLENAARALKPWPGPLNEQSAEMLRSLMRRVQRAGLIAQALRPAGYDDEVVYLITVMQNLGRLLVQYHFPDDAQQIRQLQIPPEPTQDHPNPIGLSEQAASYAVMGCDLDSLGAAVARYWSLGDELLHMIRRQPPDAAVRPSTDDADLLRLTASLGNEIVDALSLPAHKQQAAIEAVTRRYARALGVGLREVQQAINPEPPPVVVAGLGATAPLELPARVAEPKASPLRGKLAPKVDAGPAGSHGR
jgi:non-specific serine/threonine protein kinase